MAPSPDAESVTVEKSGLIVAKDSDRQIVSAPVLIPETEDRHGDVVSKENIEEVAHDFLANHQNIDVMHTLEEVGVPVESYAAPQDLTFDVDGSQKLVPEGSWMLSVKVQDAEIWQAVKDGELTGFSIYGTGKREEMQEAEA